MTISKLRSTLCLCLLGASVALPLPASAQTAAPTSGAIAERLQTPLPRHPLRRGQYDTLARRVRGGHGRKPRLRR